MEPEIEPESEPESEPETEMEPESEPESEHNYHVNDRRGSAVPTSFRVKTGEKISKGKGKKF
jgi:hypothetical protein